MIRHTGAIKWKIRDIMVIDMRYTFEKRVKNALDDKKFGMIVP